MAKDCWTPKPRETVRKRQESPSTKNSHANPLWTLDFLFFFSFPSSFSFITYFFMLDIQVPCRCPITSGWGRSCTALLAKIPPRPGDGAKQCNHIQGFYNFCFVKLQIFSNPVYSQHPSALFYLSLGAPPNLMVWNVFSHVFL